MKTLDFIAIGGAPMKEHVGSELVAQGVNLLNHWGKHTFSSTPDQRKLNATSQV